MNTTPNMQTHMFFVSLLMSLIFCVSSVSAQEEIQRDTEVPVSETASSTTTPEPTVNEAVPTVQESSSSDTTPRDTRALTVSEQERIINLVSNVLKKFSAAVLRLEQIATRLETRIEKSRSDSISYSQAEIALTNAGNALSAARGSIDAARSAANSITSETPRASFVTLRSELASTKSLIMVAYTELKNAIAAIRNPQANTLIVPPPPSVDSSTPTPVSTTSLPVAPN